MLTARSVLRPVAALLLLVAVLLAAAAPAATAADPAAKPTLFVNLTTDDAWNNEMALALAKKIQDLGYPVTVFFNVRSVRFADKNGGGKDAETTQAMTRDLMQGGATVFVCPMCSERAGMTPDQWLDGSKAGSLDTIKILMDPTTRIISY